MAGYDRDAVSRLAADRLAQGDELLLAVKLDDLRDEQGAISKARVNAAIDDVLRDRPHWGKPEPQPEAPGTRTCTTGPRPPEPPPAPSFGEFLKNAR